MPDSRQHRGAHPDDRHLFAPEKMPALRMATSDLSWLLTRGYALHSSLKLAGDRYGLGERPRVAVSRAACSDPSLERRKTTCLDVECMRNADLVVDGFNLLITVEAALGGGLIMVCRDACTRDLASVHGTYRSVLETEEALHLIGKTLQSLAPASVLWLLDRPVSNSGRLAQTLREAAALHGWPWRVEVVLNPDADIPTTGRIAITSDSSILDRVARWVNFSAHLITAHLPQAWRIDLRE